MASLLVLILAAQAAAAESVDFRGLQLGSSLEEMKAATLEPGRYGPRRVQCSDEADAPGWLAPLPAYGRAGVVQCSYVERIGSSWTRGDVPLTADHPALVEFAFYGGRLYRIELFADVEAEDAVLRGLRARWGQPSATASDELQNAYGARFPQRFTIWTRGGSRIATIAPAMNLQRMIVAYTDTAAERAVEAAVASADTPVM